MPITGCLSTKQDVPPASPVVEAPTAIFIDVVVTLVIPAHSPSLVADIVKEAASATAKVVVVAMALPSSSSRLPGSFVHLQRC